VVLLALPVVQAANRRTSRDVSAGSFICVLDAGYR
jgi:hypothetical protein